ncbi:MAG: FecR domain-containing protein [Bacteroidetes bacterium]|uniref:FecR domain-containing protein n=1 Tax=Candidatus Cryptobacteroides merdavium TaxID=2840769 RepID=A0A9D9H844_9BACT|nr:FecR domain-containing protein [Candidatus Cryptobacteroides merdavium]
MDKIDVEIIYKALRGMASEEEERLVAGWWERYPEECGRVIRECHALMDISELSGVEPASARSKRHSVLKRALIGMAAAAAAVIVALGGAFVSHRMTYDSISSRMVSVEAPKGERLKIILPDSTSVFLNSGSRLTYPVIFRKDRRQVRLDGEAMFKVTHDSERPFVVNTFASSIEVLGTEFDVIADSEAEYFETVLIAGSVKVSNLIYPGQGDVVMRPNDRLSMKNGRLLVEKIKSPEDELCWTRGLIGIDGMPFDELMKTFEKAFDVNIVIARKRLPDISSVEGKIRMSDGVENALRILQYTADFRFRMSRETNTVTIY